MTADGTRPSRAGPKRAPFGRALREAIKAAWRVCAWYECRAIGELSGIPFGTWFTLSVGWTKLRPTAEPSAVVIDNRTRGSSPNGFAHSGDGGTRIRGLKFHTAVETHGIPLPNDASPANIHDRKGILPVLRQLARYNVHGPAVGVFGYHGNHLGKAGAMLGITLHPIARSRDGVFIPTEVVWTVRSSFGSLYRHHRLNTIVKRRNEHLVAFVAIAFVSSSLCA